MTPLSFASVEQRFGYGQKASLRAEPFAELTSSAEAEKPGRAAARPSSVPLPSPRPSEAADELPSAELPVYDETKDPHVTAVLLPGVAKGDIEEAYRTRPGGRIGLPPTAVLPVIETGEVRAALASASD